MIVGRAILLITVVLGSLCAHAQAEEGAEGIAPQQGVVLLTNGEILQGKVSRAGDQYFVWVPDGEIRLPAKRVQRLCDSLDDAYRYLSQSASGSVDDHLQLVAWCLRYDLLGYAANELRAAMDIAPENPRIALLARRLELAYERPAAKVSEPSDADPKGNESGSDVIPGADSPADAMDLPAGGVAEFTSRLQPLLINKCAGVGCHAQPTESNFQLSRMPGNRNPTRRQTQQNLVEVLRWIDKDQPQNSPLLQKPLDPTHAGLTEPIFTDADQAQYDRLLEFANLAANKPPPSPVEAPPEIAATSQQTDPFPMGIERPLPSGPQAGSLPTDGAGSLGTIPEVPTMQAIERPAGDGLPGVTSPGGLPTIPQGAAPADEELSDEALLEAFETNPLQRGAVVNRFEPVDEFDPEIFNRRYFPTKKTTPKSLEVPDALPVE